MQQPCKERLLLPFYSCGHGAPETLSDLPNSHRVPVPSGNQIQVLHVLSLGPVTLEAAALTAPGGIIWAPYLPPFPFLCHDFFMAPPAFSFLLSTVFYYILPDFHLPEVWSSLIHLGIFQDLMCHSLNAFWNEGALMQLQVYHLRLSFLCQNTRTKRWKFQAIIQIHFTYIEILFLDKLLFGSK